MTEKIGWTQVTVAMNWLCFTPAQWVGLTMTDFLSCVVT